MKTIKVICHYSVKVNACIYTIKLISVREIRAHEWIFELGPVQLNRFLQSNPCKWTDFINNACNFKHSWFCNLYRLRRKNKIRSIARISLTECHRKMVTLLIFWRFYSFSGNVTKKSLKMSGKNLVPNYWLSVMTRSAFVTHFSLNWLIS